MTHIISKPNTLPNPAHSNQKQEHNKMAEADHGDAASITRKLLVSMEMKRAGTLPAGHEYPHDATTAITWATNMKRHFDLHTMLSQQDKLKLLW